MTTPVMSDAVGVSMSREAAATPGVQPTTGWLQVPISSDGIKGFDKSENLKAVDINDRLSPNLTTEVGEVIGHDANISLVTDCTTGILTWARELLSRSTTKYSGGTGVAEFVPTAVVAGSPASFTVAAGGALPNNTLVRGFNFANAANNGLHVTTGNLAGSIKTADALVAEVPPANSNVALWVAGIQGAAGDITIDATGNILSTLLDFTTLGLNPGQLCYLGDPTSGAAFTPPLAGAGYFIVGSVAAHKITTILPSYVVGVDAAAGQTVRILYHSFNCNVPMDPTGANGFLVEPSISLEKAEPNVNGSTEYTYANGMVLSKLTLDIPTENKVKLTLDFMGRKITDPGTARSAGPSTAIAPIQTGIFTTAKKMLGLRFLKKADGSVCAGEVNAMQLAYSSNADARKALAVDGATGVDTGMHEPSIKLTNVYITTNEATRAVNNGTLCTIDFVMKASDGGFGFYFPMVVPRKGSKKYTKGKAASIDIDVPADRDPATGIQFALSQFAYLP